MVIKQNESKSDTIPGKITDWATSQSFNNILLCAILLAIGWIGWYAVTTAIPAHLQMIQTGYEKIIDDHRAERGRTIDAYDKWIERMSNNNRRAEYAAEMDANGNCDEIIVSP